ncbi:glycoside hydrolase family 97 protein [Roseateles chitinivorans]|uniref:glycoside hydrolase family 97 protein n=1 Tax=Roseateles chitinivorans TaxID=2917965 RepID=UPI003D668D77
MSSLPDPARRRCALGLGAIALFGTGPASASASPRSLAEVASPDGRLVMRVASDKDGRLSYAVAHAGRPVVNASRLGLLLTNAEPLDGGFEALHAVVTAHDETWEQPWGEDRVLRDRHRELRLDLRQPRHGRAMTLRVRVFDDGLGFRYELPAQRSLPVARIADELTEFDIAESSEAWWSAAGERLVLEMPVQHTPLAETGLANTPLTLRTRSGLHLALHEAALVDYATMWLRRVDGQKLRAQLAPSATGPAVERRGAFVTPWRTLQVSETATGLLDSRLTLHLNEPNRLGDVTWFKPGKFVGIWWEMHLGRSTWSPGPQQGATTANARRHIDFAADNGFDGILVEGWNRGWDSDWPGNGASFDFLRPVAGFDLRQVAAYARERGVRLIGHHETGGNVAHYEQQMDRAYALYEQLGVRVVKSGYVADVGAARFADPWGPGTHRGFTESQEGVRHFQRAVERAARHRIAVDTHEPVKDTGLRRTWPNWVTREGARGQEFNAWGEPINAVDHEIRLLYTRMMSGPMDFTPGVVSLDGANGRRLPSTVAKQLALYVVLYSPLVMVPDLIEHYAQAPDAFDFIRHVPTDWERSRALAGEVGRYAVIARQQRGSRDWYLGAIADGEARETDIALDFLPAGQRFDATIWRDGDAADHRDLQRRFDLVVERREVSATDRMQLRIAPGGGWAIWLTPLGSA